MPLPRFSADLEPLMNSDTLWAAMDKIIEQTAFSVLGNGDMTTREEYDNFGSRMVAKYPKLATKGERPYGHFLKKLSKKLRNMRGQSKKRSEQVQIKDKVKKQKSTTPKAEAEVVVNDERYEANLQKLQEINSSDKPDPVKKKLLMSKTFENRRIWLKELKTTDPRTVLEKFPALGEAQSVSLYYFQ